MASAELSGSATTSSCPTVFWHNGAQPVVKFSTQTISSTSGNAANIDYGTNKSSAVTGDDCSTSSNQAYAYKISVVTTFTLDGKSLGSCSVTLSSDPGLTCTSGSNTTTSFNETTTCGNLKTTVDSCTFTAPNIYFYTASGGHFTAVYESATARFYASGGSDYVLSTPRDEVKII